MNSVNPVVTGAPDRNLRFWVPALTIPFVTMVGMLLWQGDAGGAFRVLQLVFGWAAVIQFLLVLTRVFTCGWYELFAYVLHMLATGAAALTVTFRLELYPQDLLYDQCALLGLAGQLMIGTMVLTSRPLQTKAQLNPRVLTACALVVCTAALVKFGYYLQYTGFQSGAHLEIYTDGDAVRDNSPAPIRILAAGSPLIALLAMTQPGLPRWCRVLGIVAVMLEFAIGIRSRPLFIILSALSLIQYRVHFTPTRKLVVGMGAVLAIIAIACIGYFRENNSVGAEEYFWIILESLFGIFEAGVFGAQIPDTIPIIVGQIWPLLAPTPLGSVDTVAKLLTSTFTPKAYVAGFGYSSAALTETVMLFGPLLSGILYPLIVLGIIRMIRAAVTSAHVWKFLYGACSLPIAFYIWRAELWQLVVPAIKALPFIAILLCADAYARLGKPRAALRPPPANQPEPSA
ncbi:hypothetical protein [uncultured Sphingomonas sp.]|uniref:hypothetical protein n=1 Tax=uncultured Sphingomonas sp. TaxID=158754 RepID=UPI003749EF08